MFRSTIRRFGIGAYRRALNSNYQVGEEIGYGAFGTVHAATCISTGRDVAVKIIDLKREHSQEVEVLMRLSKKSNDNVLKLLDTPFDDSGNQTIVSERYSGGDLFDFVADSGFLSEDVAKDLLRQAAEGISAVHESGFAHNDVKLENFVFNKEGKLVLIDFGDARMTSFFGLISERALSMPRSLRGATVGTLSYCSPEVLSGSFTSKSDVWSLGVCLYAMLSGDLPFPQDTCTGKREELIKAGSFEPLPESVSPLAADLVNRMLTVDPASRLSIKEVQRHPWMSTL